MSFWDVVGGVERTIINGVPSGMDNDQGSIRYAGSNIAEPTKWTNVALGADARVTTVVSGVNGVTGILSAGAFNGGDQVIVRVTTDLAGVANTVLLAGASNSANRENNSIKRVTTASSYQYKTAIRENRWSSFSGAWQPGFPEVVNSGVWSQQTDTDVSSVVVSSGVDHAAHPSGYRPGELVYRDGSPAPVQDDYKAKTIF